MTALINGESGTGKELVARALHDFGRRKDKPFVAVNMAAIPRELIESELFGHEKGAFTGAIARGIGKFELAQGGTLFLDEIGDMPMEAQTRLLRVLQTGEFTSVGGRAAQKADVRIIAATHRDLRQLIAQGRFREDLFYRLNVVPIHLPPLRERRGRHRRPGPALPRQGGAATGLASKTLSTAAIEELQRYDWPGNVRELENLMRRIAVLYSEAVIDARMVAESLAAGAAGRDGKGGGRHADETLSQSVERHLRAYFAAHQGRLPANGLYDRILQEIERPLLTICLRGDARQPDQGGGAARPQPQHAAQEAARARHPCEASRNGGMTEVAHHRQEVQPGPAHLRLVAPDQRGTPHRHDVPGAGRSVGPDDLSGPDRRLADPEPGARHHLAAAVRPHHRAVARHHHRAPLRRAVGRAPPRHGRRQAAFQAGAAVRPDRADPGHHRVGVLDHLPQLRPRHLVQRQGQVGGRKLVQRLAILPAGPSAARRQRHAVDRQRDPRPGLGRLCSTCPASTPSSTARSTCAICRRRW